MMRLSCGRCAQSTAIGMVERTFKLGRQRLLDCRPQHPHGPEQQHDCSDQVYSDDVHQPSSSLAGESENAAQIALAP
jgi:hypothetical protein